MTKICNVCGIEKDLDSFHNHTSTADRKHPTCKECRSSIRRVKYKPMICPICKKSFIPKKSDILTCGNAKCSYTLSKSKRKDKISEYNKQYHTNVRYGDPKRAAKHREQSKQYSRDHREEKSKYQKKYREENKEQLKEQKKEYFSRPEIRKYRNLYELKRKHENPELRAIHNLRNRLNKLIKRGDKSETTMQLLGCSVKKFKSHIESMFSEDMDWSNYGEWHIDHIVPCNRFNLLDTKEQKVCFHYTNLQPLWAEDNISKSDKVIVNFGKTINLGGK